VQLSKPGNIFQWHILILKYLCIVFLWRAELTNKTINCLVMGILGGRTWMSDSDTTQGHYFVWQLLPILNSDRFEWRQAAQRYTLIQFDVSRNSYVPVQCIPVNAVFFFLLALQLPLGVVFYSPLAGFSILAYEVSWSLTTTRHSR